MRSSLSFLQKRIKVAGQQMSFNGLEKDIYPAEIR